MLSQIQQQQLIQKLQIFQIKGKDKQGRQILRIIAKFLPAKVVCVEAVKRYLEEEIYPELEQRPFAVVYFHTDVEKSENFPGVSALRSIYEAIPSKVKENLESVYFVHPGLQPRLFFATFGRFIFSAGLYEKLMYISRVDYLWEHVRRNEINIPDFVHEHDEDLEYRPMMDYGMESDHLRVYGGPPALDSSSVSMYSLRCSSS